MLAKNMSLVLFALLGFVVGTYTSLRDIIKHFSWTLCKREKKESQNEEEEEEEKEEKEEAEEGTKGRKKRWKNESDEDESAANVIS